MSRRPADHANALPDHYAVLDVGADATTAQIKRAYRELAKTSHPDISKSPDATAKFAKIAEAHAVLSDPKRRATYDRQLRERAEASKPVDTRAHYTWTNIAAHGAREAEAANRESEIDEMYDTFFSPKAAKPKAAKPEPTRTSTTRKRKSP